MTLPSRLWDLVDALRAHAATGEPLMRHDMLALASALQGEAEALSRSQRARSVKGWTARKDVSGTMARVRSHIQRMERKHPMLTRPAP